MMKSGDKVVVWFIDGDDNNWALIDSPWGDYSTYWNYDTDENIDREKPWHDIIRLEWRQNK